MAQQIDALIATLTQTMGLSVLVVTHDLDTLYTICNRVAVLADSRIIAIAPVRELEGTDHPWLRQYLMGKRSRAGHANLHVPLLETRERR